jgi:hypothetical protein
MAARVENLAVWGRHIVAGLRAQALRHPLATAVDVTLAELHLGTWLPANQDSAGIPYQRAAQACLH